jgi:hypothetical protein
VDVVLDTAPFLAVKTEAERKEMILHPKNNGLYKKYPPAIYPDMEHPYKMYLPFASIAKAFGVPSSNVKWDGKTLRMYWNKNVWVEFKSDSNYAVWHNKCKKKLEAPAKVKNGVMMVDCPNTHWTILPSDPLIDGAIQPLLFAMPQTCSSGITTGKPYITCSVCDWSK